MCLGHLLVLQPTGLKHRVIRITVCQNVHHFIKSKTGVVKSQLDVFLHKYNEMILC